MTQRQKFCAEYSQTNFKDTLRRPHITVNMVSFWESKGFNIQKSKSVTQHTADRRTEIPGPSRKEQIIPGPIKSTHGKPTADIILSWEKLKASSLTSGTRQG